MIRDSKFSRRNSGKNLNFEETENIPVNSNLRELSGAIRATDSYLRPPLNTIQEPPQNPSKPDHELGFKTSKIYRTPSKPKLRNPESGLRTPEKQGALARNRYGWGQDSKNDGRIWNLNTPSSCRITGRPSSVFSEPNSTNSTPTKSAIKPPNPGLIYGGARTSNFTALSKGIPVTYNSYTTVNTIDVPHFDLREDPSFWMDHNVQVLIRIRPLNGMEISSQGYNRCLKQESAQCLTWVGHPETRFTFDHVACETIDQETLFKMVGLPMVENCLSGYNSCMFAYGQTGSGKTHTMLGEINDLEIKPSPNRGMTPRIFEFLFARIVAEEESRKDERIIYNCKCSFLEIYNEQITDLLDPSSTNLQLREDVKKGVYVENLTEYEVNSVGDILKLLSQGSANRRVAATNMNRESSRSHSVFTCVIESRWEKDSTSNLRYARLNLVDLAGSERQKTSGAEGERLKEAANINKSLSTLGHVIMVLVDGANARARHVPYRDSRLTFLLQDSLGGNSKTMIIANVSPSISSATETLNTLKFAQRAKLIQNNAVINEDFSGDVVALQHQIRLLKEEVAILKRHNISRSLTFSSKDENFGNASSIGDDDQILRVSCKQLKSLETSLNGALRREKTTENCIKQLEAEIEQLNCLVRQREEENRCTKMMLKFREDKIQKMESVFSGLISADSYLIEENNTLTEEIKILRAKVDKNPEVTRFAVENIRLLEQLKRFQDFYEEGEREMLLTEVSELRDQLVLFLEENLKQDYNMIPSMEKEAAEDKNENNSLQSELKKCQEELEKCRDNLNSCLEENAKLCRELVDLNALLEMQKSRVNDGSIEVIKESILESSSIKDQSSHTVQEKDEIFKKDPEEIVDLELQLDIFKSILKEEISIRVEIEEKFLLTQQELTLLREKYEEKDRNFNNVSEEFDLLTKKIEEVLTVGCNALDDASNMIGHGKRKWVSEKLEIIARNISEKELRIDELNTCLEDAKVRGNKMELMLRSLRGASLVISEAHQKDCIKKDEEIDKLLSELNEKNAIIIQMEEQRKLYEVELMDAKINATQQAVESSCYLDKFVEIQHKIKKADLIVNKLLTENEAMKMEISHQNQVINDKREKFRCFEVKLQQAALENNDLEKEKISMFMVFEKFKEDIIISYVDLHFKELILLEKDAEISFLQEKVKMQEELRLHKEENEKLVVKIKNQKDEIEEFEGFFESLEFELYENIVKSLVLETRLTENVEDALKAKKSTEEKLAETKKAMESLEIEIIEFKTAFDEKDNLIESLKGDLKNVSCERDDFLVDFLETKQLYELELTDAKKNESQKSLESCCYIDKFVEIQNNIKETDFMINKLMTDLSAKDIELFIMSSKLDQVASENIDLENEKLNMFNVLEMFKEEIIVSYVDLDFKDLMLLEELRLHKEEKETHVVKIEKQKNEIEEFEGFFQALECELYENIVKNVVLEAWLTENVENALKGKKSIEEQLADSKMEILEFKTALDEKSNLNLSLKGDLKSVTCEKDNLHVEFLKAKQLYELELMDAKINSTQHAVDSCYYLDKFVETQNNIKEADLIINNLVTENEAMKMEISHQKQVINDKDEKVTCVEATKEIELLLILSKLEQVASENNDFEKEKISMSTVFEKFKEDIIISYVDNKWILLEKNAEVELAQAVAKENEAIAMKAKKACETSKYYAQEKEEELKLYEKSVEELECTVNLLENQVDLVKGDAKSQRLQREELQLEVQKIHQQTQLLTKENETFKIENVNYKMKVIELEDELKKLSGQQNLEQHIHHLAKMKEENNTLKAQNDEISHKLRRAEAIVTRVKEELANLRVVNGRKPC